MIETPAEYQFPQKNGRVIHISKFFDPKETYWSIEKEYMNQELNDLRYFRGFLEAQMVM